jgi:peptidoglycan/xylan/chitin deacetylase (PgdA/CDA1 family)
VRAEGRSLVSAWSAGRWGRIGSALFPRAAVLLYHRIAEVSRDPWRLCVTPQHFAQHCDVLARRQLVRPLSTLLTSLAGGRRLRRTVSITFDDGYADNLNHARPQLIRHGLPATIFVTAGAVGASREFWWDELEGLLLDNHPLPPALTLGIGGTTRHWDLGAAAAEVDIPAAVDRMWKPWEDAHPTVRHGLYRELYDLLFPLAIAERTRVLDAMGVWAGRAPAVRASHRTLTEGELSALAREAVVDVGCHTMTHPALVTLSPAAQRAEIVDARDRLAALTGRPVRSFAYPYGRRRDYDAGTVGLVREVGFTGACANFPGLARRDTDPFQVPRLQVRDWDGDTFAARLDAWLAGDVG